MNILLESLNKILLESYSDKVDLIKRFLDKNFMRASIIQNGKTYNIFVLLNNYTPTDKSLWKQDVIDILDNNFHKIIKDKKERDSFFNQIVNDWYFKRISSYGSLSNYSF